MSNNEETLYGEVKFNMGNKKSGGGSLWKKVGFGSMAGILLGAGALYGYDQYQNASNGKGTITADNNDSNVVDDGQNDSNEQNTANEQNNTNDQPNTATDNNNAQFASTSYGHAAQGGAHHAAAPAYTHHVVDVDDPNAVIYEEAPLAEVDDNMTFEQAFAEARAEVGPGGVFVWHGGIYSTYNESEWNAMSEEQHTEYAQSVDAQVIPEDIPTDILEEYPNYVINVVVADGEVKEVAIIPYESSDDVDVDIPGDDGGMQYVNNVNDDDDDQVVDDDEEEEVDDGDVVPYEDNDDVAQADHFIESEDVVEYGEVEGHEAAILDMTDDGEADVMVVDIDDSHNLTEPDVMVFEDGSMTSVGDFVEAVDAAAEEDVAQDDVPGEDILASTENPDVAPDMPDYMDDANILA